MTFVRTVDPAEAEGQVREMYEGIEQQCGEIPNWATIFSLRPPVRDAWNTLLKTVRSNLPVRTYELATMTAARALQNTYCALAHGKVLADDVFDSGGVAAIATGAADAPLEPREVAMIAFVEKMVRNAVSVTAGDVETLRSHGYSDADIFDIAAAASARCFFSTLLDALGVQADRSYLKLDPPLREALIVGRPIAGEVS
jgi:uncharacterized peroxidase-related enzyme